MKLTQKTLATTFLISLFIFSAFANEENKEIITFEIQPVCEKENGDGHGGCDRNYDDQLLNRDPWTAYLDTNLTYVDVTEGTLSFGGEVYKTFERPLTDNQFDGCDRCVLPGIYKVTVNRERFHGSHTPRLEDLNGRTGILIHRGKNLVDEEGKPRFSNVNEWSDGCILLSEEEMNQFKELLSDFEITEFTLVINRK